MKILHISTLPLDQMGDITRIIIGNCEGEHEYYNLGKRLKVDSSELLNSYIERTLLKLFKHSKHDIFVLHCFKNQWKYFFNFKHPNDSCKIISVVHSSFPCVPSQHSDYVVTISNAASEHLRKTTEIRSTVIPGAIDLTEYLQIQPNYDYPIMGKISRTEPGKFHPMYFDVLSRLSEKYGALIRMIAPGHNGVIPENITVDTSVKINDNGAKARALYWLNIYADAHQIGEGVFIETLCTSLLEAMACGLPCVILGEDQPAMVEVLGDGGFVAKNIYEFYQMVEHLVSSEQARREWGIRARIRAKEFNNLGKMITSYNNLFKAAYDENII